MSPKEHEKIQQLKDQIESLQKDVDMWRGMYNVALDRTMKQETIMLALKSALEYYGNPDSWCGSCESDDSIGTDDLEVVNGYGYVGGKKARQVLRNIEG